MIFFSNFVAESVSDGHPDKLADQISDAAVDAILAQDKYARIALETLIKDHTVVLAGEISGNFSDIDWDALVRNVLVGVGHGDVRWGLDPDRINIIPLFTEQSSDIAQSVVQGEKLGAGDQGIMYGYACNQTPEFMPLAIACAHRLMKQHKRVRVSETVLGPDAKCQVTLRQSELGCFIDNVVFSTQHTVDLSLPSLRELVVEEIIRPCLASELLQNARFIVNPSGHFVLGGPIADCGVTGRKIMVDTYGSAAPHGGGAFSGKDPTKVDRSAAYMARYIAKQWVAQSRGSEALVVLAYAIGTPEPVLVKMISDGGTSDDGANYIHNHFDITPRGIIDTLDLRRPIYRNTASFGHFGRLDVDLPWERLWEDEKR